MTEWRKHTGTCKPPEFADAQIVEIGHLYATGKIFDGTSGIFDRADSAPWSMVMEYRPALDPDGLPYVSAEGLEDWAEYVAVSDVPDGVKGADQFRSVPNWTGKYWSVVPGPNRVTIAPDTHAIPGDPEHSLARVWRE